MRTRSRAALALLGAAALLLAGCTSASPTSPQSSGAAGGPDLAAAQKFLAPWLQTSGKKLLIDTPLSKPVDKSLRVAYLDVGTPVAAAMLDILNGMAKAAGITLDDVKTGQDAQSINTAMNSVVEGHYDGVINVTLDPINFQPQLKQLQDAKVPITSFSVMDTEENGMPEAFNGPDWMQSEGAALAASAIIRTNGQATNFVLYTVPEFPFAQYQVTGFHDEMTKLCPSCTVRDAEIPIVDLGSKSQDDIVSDLQAHPETQYYVAIADEGTIGLASKLNLAGITVKGVGTWPVPANVQQVADGSEDATLGIDLGLAMWTISDQLFREINGDSYTWPDAQTRAYTFATLLTKDNAGPFTQYGYTAIPDFQDQFLKLWGLK